MKLREEYTCSLELTQDLIRGKWKPIILWQLGKGSASLSSLHKEIKGINQKMLIEHLKELQEFHIVGKNYYDGYPLKVEYFLTSFGKRMLEIVISMQQIGIELMKDNIIDQE